jgi:hypothetical protein
MAAVCTACHGENLAGMPPNAEGDKPAPNLTPNGELGSWTEEEFISTLQTGVTPEGDTLDPEQMPWPELGTTKAADLRAIWLYLQSLPAKTSNERQGSGN